MRKRAPFCFIVLVAIAIFALGTHAGRTQDAYPSRLVKIVVPAAAGSTTDSLARIVADQLGQKWARSVIVENIAGGAMNVGASGVARAAPDGYTLQIGQWGTNLASGAVHNLPIDLLKDLEPVALLCTQPFMIVGKKALPVDTLKDLIAWLKANADKVSVGTSGPGSPSHVAGVFFQNAIGAKFQFVPYRSAGLSTQDLVAGQIDMIMDTAATSGGHVKNGLIKAYAITGKTRSGALPEVPTVDEAGLPGFYFYFWHAVWVPKGTPKDVVAKLNAAVVEALADATVRARLTELGQELLPRERLTPEALGAYQKAETEKWWPVVKAAGIKVE